MKTSTISIFSQKFANLFRQNRYIIIIGLCLTYCQSLIAQSAKIENDYISIDFICKKVSHLFESMDEVEGKGNQRAIYNYFKNKEKGTIYNDIQRRGTTVEEYVNDLIKYGKRIHTVECSVSYASNKTTYTIYAQPNFLKDQKTETHLLKKVFEIQIKFDKGRDKIIINNFGIKDIDKIDFSGCEPCNQKRLDSLTRIQINEKLSTSILTNSNISLDRIFDETRALFNIGYIDNIKKIGSGKFLYKKEAEKYLNEILDADGRYQPHTTPDYLDKGKFIDFLKTNMFDFSASGLIIKPMDGKRQKIWFGADKINIEMNIEYTAKIGDRIVLREAEIRYKQKDKTKKNKKHIQIFKLSNRSISNDIDKLQAKKHVENFVINYNAALNNIISKAQNPENVFEKYFLNSTNIDNDLSLNNDKNIFTIDYLKTISRLNSLSKINYKNIHTNQILRSDKANNLFYTVVNAEINHEIFTDTSIISINGVIDFIVQFKQLDNGYLAEPSIERVNILSPLLAVENYREENKNDYFSTLTFSELDIVKRSFLDNGFHKVKSFIVILSNYKKSDRIDENQIRIAESLFLNNGKFSKIGVSNYKNNKKFKNYNIEEYFKHLISYNYDEHKFYPYLITDTASVTFQPVKGDVDKWVTKMQFKQLFDGKHKNKDKEYCDETLKEITIFVVKENDSYNTYLGDIVPIIGETIKRKCREKTAVPGL